MPGQAFAQGDGVGQPVGAGANAFRHLRLDAKLLVHRKQHVVDHVAVVAHDVRAAPDGIEGFEIRVHDDLVGRLRGGRGQRRTERGGNGCEHEQNLARDAVADGHDRLPVGTVPW